MVKFNNEGQQGIVNVAFIYCNNTDTVETTTLMNRYGLFYSGVIPINQSITRYTVNLPNDMYNSFLTAIQAENKKCVISRENLDSTITLGAAINNVMNLATTNFLVSTNVTYNTPYQAMFDGNLATYFGATTGGVNQMILVLTLPYTVTCRFFSFAYINSYPVTGSVEFHYSLDGTTYTLIHSSTTNGSIVSQQVTGFTFKYLKIMMSQNAGAGSWNIYEINPIV